jgi:NitT/TauT family transport system substrate-binding protein
MLTTGKVDGIGQYTVGEPLLAAAAAPQEVRGLAYADAGLDYYSNGIVAADSTIAANPDLVRRFVRATLDGLKAAMADPASAGEILHKYHREIDTDIAVGEMRKVTELAVQPNAPLGTIDPARIAKTIDIVAAAFELKRAVAAGDVYAAGFLPH